METQSHLNTKPTNEPNQNPDNGRMLAGIVIVVVGSVILAHQVGVDLPHWLFSWPMFLVALGFYIGARHRFRSPGWIFPVVIGIAFTVDHMIPELNFGNLVWPGLIIIAGLAMIFRRSKGGDFFKKWDRDTPAFTSTEGFMDSVTIFGENKKQILSKDFRGGESVCVFGGAEINLTQSDINGRITLELVQVFGGTKLLVPSHWKIEMEEMVSIFGGVNDKRQLQNVVTDQSKVLVLRGTSIFGGIDIKSF